VIRGPFRLIEAPFHLGLEGVAVGAGPRKLVEAGADRVLSHRGIPAEVEHVRLRDSSAQDLDAIVDMNRQLRAAVRQAREEEVFPVVLAGNCNSCLGSLAGLEPALTGIVWLDAHADFNTPETTISGSLEGMALAIAVGDCHAELRLRCGLESPVRAGNVYLPVTRDLDPGERARLVASAISTAALPEVETVYLHLDMDFLDPSESPGVSYRAPGGVPLEHACAMVRSIAAELPLGAVALTNYNPDLDQGDRTLRAALRLLEQLVPSPVR